MDANAIYRERNHIAAGLARLVLRCGGNAWIGTDPSEPEWPVLFIDLPTGQVSWHFSPDDTDLLNGIPTGSGGWDGHSTPEKYARLRRLLDDDRAREAESLLFESMQMELQRDMLQRALAKIERMAGMSKGDHDDYYRIAHKALEALLEIWDTE